MKAVLYTFLATTLTGAASLAVAQEPTTDFDALGKQLKYRLGPQGQLQIWPDPTIGDVDNPSFGDIFTPRQFLENSGVFGYLLMVGSGNGDLTSQSDTDWLLDLIGRGDDQNLFAAIQTDSNPLDRARERMRILAIRAVQKRKLKAATPLLEKLAADDAADLLARRAARQALATLNGTVYAPTPIHTLEPVADLLRGVEFQPDFVAVVENYKLPTSRIFAELGREISLTITKRVIGEAGGSVSLPAWAGANSIASLPSMMGYEWSRRLGNMRIDRMVVAAEYNTEIPTNPGGMVVIDGVFDVEQIKAALETMLEDEVGVTIESNDGVLTVKSQMGVSWTISNRRFSGTVQIREDQPAPDAEALDRLVASLDSDAPIRLRRREGFDLELPQEIRQFVDLNSVDLWLPRTTTEPIRAEVQYRTEASARTVSVLARGLPRMLSGSLDRSGIEDPAVDNLAGNIDEMEVEREGATLRASLPLNDLDIKAILRAVAPLM